MKNRNIINSSDANEGNNTSAWDNLGGDSSLPSEEYFESQPSYSSNEEIVAGAVEAEKNAVEYGEGAKIGEDFAHSLIEMVQSGQMSMEEARVIYEGLKKRKEDREAAINSEIVRQREEEQKFEQERKKSLLEKINNNPVAKKVISGVMSVAILAGGYAAARKIMSNKTNKADDSFVQTVDADETTAAAQLVDDSSIESVDADNTAAESDDNNADNNDGELETDDGFETMANGVRYAKDAYSNERRSFEDENGFHEGIHNFTNEMRETWEDEEKAKETLISIAEKDPVLLASFFTDMPDAFKGEYAGMSSTYMATAICGSGEVQQFCLDSFKDFVEKCNIEFFIASGEKYNNALVEYEIRDKGEESTPANVRLGSNYQNVNGQRLYRLAYEEGGNQWQSDEHKIDCTNDVDTDPTDGHVDIPGNVDPTPAPDPEPDPTPEDPTPEDPTPEDPTPEDPTPEDPTPEDPTPEDPTPEDPTPEDPTPEDPTPEDPTPEDPTPEDPTPEDPTPEDPTPEDPAPKDEENLKRIDEQINDDIAEDIGTKEIVITPTEDVVEEEGEATEAPIEISDGGGTEHKEFEQNDDSKEAEKVDQEQIKEDGNDYSEDKGGAHDDEYAPVKDDHEAQEEADKKAGLEENNGGLTDEEINELYDKYFPKEEDGEKEDGDGGDTEDDEMDADQKYKEAIAAKNKEEAENLSDEELEDIYKDLGL